MSYCSGNHGLNNVANRHDYLIWDTSAFYPYVLLPGENREGLNQKIERVEDSIKYMNVIIKFFKANAGKLIIPQTVFNELDPDRVCTKKTEKKLRNFFRKKDRLANIVEKSIPRLKGSDKEFMRACRDKYTKLTQMYQLSSTDFDVILHGLFYSQKGKCAILTNDGGIIGAYWQLRHIFNSKDSTAEENVQLKLNFRCYTALTDGNFAPALHSTQLYGIKNFANRNGDQEPTSIEHFVCNF